MILYIENPKDTTRKLLDLINEYSKVAGYKINTQESLRRNGVANMVNKRVLNAILGCNLKNDRMICVRFQGKPFNIKAKSL